MTLGGLAAAVGLVIDDAIVVVENIVIHRDSGQGRLQAIHSALQEITIPLIGSTVTPIVVFLPLISITGVTGTFFRALAVTMGVSLLTSLVLALTWTPTLSQYFIHAGKATEPAPWQKNSPKKNRSERLLAAEEASLGGFFRKIVDFHERWLRRALAKPLWLAALSLVLVVVAYVCYRYSGSDLMPEMDEGGFTLDYWTPAGSFAGGNQPHGDCHGADSECHSRSREQLAAHRPGTGAGGGHGSQPRRHPGEAEERSQPRD